MTLKNDLSLCTAASVSWHLILVEEGKKKKVQWFQVRRKLI